MDGLLSLIFFMIEIGIAIIVYTRAKNNPNYKLIASLIVILSLYQLSEFLICSGLITRPVMNRVGFAIITFLPPTGYYLSDKIVNRNGFENILNFGVGIGFAGYYLFTDNSVQLIDCNPLYAIYRYSKPMLYGLFYYGVILMALIILGLNMLRDNTRSNSKYMMLGYMLFLTPMGLTVLFDPTYMRAIPSIMCKYAILLAFTLGFLAFQSN